MGSAAALGLHCLPHLHEEGTQEVPMRHAKRDQEAPEGSSTAGSAGHLGGAGGVLRGRTGGMQGMDGMLESSVGGMPGMLGAGQRCWGGSGGQDEGMLGSLDPNGR